MQSMHMDTAGRVPYCYIRAPSRFPPSDQTSPQQPAFAKGSRLRVQQAMALQNRMARELRTLEREPPDGVCVLLPDEANPLQLRARLQGPPCSPYEEGLFELDIRIPERYPFEPPKVQFATPCYHPNIDQQGRICLDLLNPPPKGSWTPALNIARLLAGVRQLLLEPNPDDPLLPDIAEEVKHSRSLFEVKARQHTAAHARGPATTPSATTSSQQQQPQEQRQHQQQQQQQQQQRGPEDAAGGGQALLAAAGRQHGHATPLPGQAGARGSTSSQRLAADTAVEEAETMTNQGYSTAGAASGSTVSGTAAAADENRTSRPTALVDITNQAAGAVESLAPEQHKVAGHAAAAAALAAAAAGVKPVVADMHGKQRKRLCLRR